MFPIVNIGPAAIQTAGLILLTSLWIGIWLTSKYSRALGTNGDVIENSLLTGLIAGILGARIGYMLQYPDVFTSNPLNLISLTPTMLDTSFGLLVGLLTAYIISQKKNLPLWPTLDTLSPFIIIIYAGIQVANLANGDAFGLPTRLPWGISLWEATRHPVQIYALVLTAALSTFIYFKTEKLKTTGMQKKGVLFLSVAAGLGIVTVITGAFVAQRTNFLGIGQWQFLGWLVMAASLVSIYLRVYQNQKPVPVLLSMGSNVNPHNNLSKAFEMLGQRWKITNTSSTYQTEDVRDKKVRQLFLNQVVEIQTEMSFEELRSTLKSMENTLGRQPGNKDQVPIDLDILTYGSEVFTQRGNTIPSPDLIRYRYLAEPVSEAVPHFRHPASGKSIEDILLKMKDSSNVKRLKKE